MMIKIKNIETLKMRLHLYASVVLCSIIFSGCALSPEYRARMEQIERQEQQQRAEAARQREIQRKNAIENQCVGYGFQRGTPLFSNCLMKLDIAQREAMSRHMAVEAQNKRMKERCDDVASSAFNAANNARKTMYEASVAGSEARTNCLAGLPPPATVPQMRVSCTKVNENTVNCSNN